MELSTVNIKNYRLLSDVTLDIHKDITLIVGRNNTAKTSCFDCICSVLRGRGFAYDDYPISQRKFLYDLFAQYMNKELTYIELCQSVPRISIEFVVDYSIERPEDHLGALSPFIIDVDLDTTVALVNAEYSIKMEESALWNLLEKSFYNEGAYNPSIPESRDTIITNFSKIFGLTIYAVNPKNQNDKQVKSAKELENLFPHYLIPAERVLGEDGSQKNNSLSSLISSFFDVAEEELDPSVAGEVMKLRKIVEDANKGVQTQSDIILGSLVNKAVGFGYPNAEELQLGVTTSLTIDDQIKNQTTLSYLSGSMKERLPSTHNGLGYKNLIKIEFLLAAFAKEIEKSGQACIPLLFIEEPESHMHPQMQRAFADYLEEFLKGITNIHIQTFLTSHSAHIANTMDFSKIRYAQKTINGVEFKNLDIFAQANEGNMEFIRKYLTLSRCDLFFADKIIFVEGASERILLPDMIMKCKNKGLFDAYKYKLTEQYYSIIEIGGAFAFKFIPFTEFLGIPCLILTDIDSTDDDRRKAFVSEGTTTSNSTIKWWMKKQKSLKEDDEIKLSEVVALSAQEKTLGKCHIEFQTIENGLCGRSLEEAIINVNRTLYDLAEPVSETSITYTENKKTDFALQLVFDNPDYEIPQYISNGLVWLNNQRVLS